jgi:hypothetical protein
MARPMKRVQTIMSASSPGVDPGEGWSFVPEGTGILLVPFPATDRWAIFGNSLAGLREWACAEVENGGGLDSLVSLRDAGDSGAGPRVENPWLGIWPRGREGELWRRGSVVQRWAGGRRSISR